MSRSPASSPYLFSSSPISLWLIPLLIDLTPWQYGQKASASGFVSAREVFLTYLLLLMFTCLVSHRCLNQNHSCLSSVLLLLGLEWLPSRSPFSQYSTSRPWWLPTPWLRHILKLFPMKDSAEKKNTGNENPSLKEGNLFWKLCNCFCNTRGTCCQSLASDIPELRALLCSS